MFSQQNNTQTSAATFITPENVGSQVCKNKRKLNAVYAPRKRQETEHHSLKKKYLPSKVFNGTHGDVNIYLGTDRELFKCFGSILSTLSCFFDNILNNGMRESKEKEIEIPESKETFEYLYQFASGCDFPPKTHEFLNVFRAADKYLIDNLKQNITTKWLGELSLKDILMYYDHCAADPTLKEFGGACERVLQRQSYDVLTWTQLVSHSFFTTLKEPTVDFILTLEHMRLVEQTKVWTALVKWTDAKYLTITPSQTLNTPNVNIHDENAIKNNKQLQKLKGFSQYIDWSRIPVECLRSEAEQLAGFTSILSAKQLWDSILAGSTDSFSFMSPAIGGADDLGNDSLETILNVTI